MLIRNMIDELPFGAFLRDALSVAIFGVVIVGGTIAALELIAVRQPLYIAIVIGVSAVHISVVVAWYLLIHGSQNALLLRENGDRNAVLLKKLLGEK